MTAASFALVIVMSVSLAQTTLFFIENLNQAETSQGQTTQRAQPRTALDTSQIRNLFGNFQAEAIVADQNVPETSLNLELKGVFTADNAKDSTAIVAQRGQSGQLYGIGDRLPGNATLESIFPNYILIKRGARTEKLAFDDPLVGQGFSRQSQNSTKSLGNQVVLGPDGATSTRLPNSQSVAQQSVSRLDDIRERIANRSSAISAERSQSPDLRGAINDFQNRLTENPDAVLKELGVSTSGSGFKIGSQVPQAMLRQTGLQQGDVVLSVNGQDASNVASNKSLMNQVMQSERARVEVQRGQRRFFVTVPIPKNN